ncbi:MAG TPA: RsmE family RNA methyltransferase, partial [Oceanipulchritudo sp.]|nr:RsmE family RNA methyltransferase [Oceanipulchritudo sp.]
RQGEPVEVLNGRGALARCRVEAVSSREIQFTVDEVNRFAAPVLRRHLLVALPKGKTFPALLHKAVELGVSEITPLMTTHAEADPGRAEQKRDRFESILIEALKQSGNPWMPQLNATTALDEVLSATTPGVQRLCAALQPEARPLWTLLGHTLQPTGTIEVFVGPEGDFSTEEYARLREAGCTFASLGPLVLKVETAASLVLGALALWSAPC